MSLTDVCHVVLCVQDVKIMIPPCRNVQRIEDVLEDCKPSILPIILYAVNKEVLSQEQVSDVQRVRKCMSFPVCFIRMPTEPTCPEPPRSGDTDRSPLYKQLLALELIGSTAGNCACGAPAQTPGGKMQGILGESLERLQRVLVPFTRQVLQTQQAEAAHLLNGVHCRCLDLFINQVMMHLQPPTNQHRFLLIDCVFAFRRSTCSEICRSHRGVWSTRVRRRASSSSLSWPSPTVSKRR